MNKQSKQQKMKTKKTISALMSTAALTLAAIAPSFGQSNLGASCGCPPVASRPTVLLSTKGDTIIVPGVTAGLGYSLRASNTVLSCDTTYILDRKIYVQAGKSLTIQPGTVIKGRAQTLPINATALVVERNAKVFAAGSSDCQIVFTAEADPMDGSYGIANRGKWGGIVILGKAKNNLLTTNTLGNFPGNVNGVGFIEGFTSANTQNLFGSPVGSEDQNDNSGILKYVSIRHSGALVAVGNELNGLTLGSVGAGTTIDHIEVISNDDDGIELFGGNVNLKYCATLFGADDGLDYDLGWSGKVQFFLNVKADAATTPSADNGIEADADDNKSNALPRSHPFIYNATFIGNGNNTAVGDNSGPFGLNAKELTEGEIYNSVFANYKSGFNMTKALGTRTGTIEAYDNWINGSLVVKNNTFVGNTSDLTVDKLTTNVLPSDITKYAADGNVTVASLTGVTGFNPVAVINSANNSVTTKLNATPKPILATSIAAPTVGGFFTPANYRGAFEANKPSWLSQWSYANLVAFASGTAACTTDLNGDGVINNSDFLIFVGTFNQSCQ
jgi:trimeric autotransporter adhesin